MEKKLLNKRASQRLSNLQRAFAQFQSAISEPITNERDLAGLVKTFEFTLELTWKTLRDILESESEIVEAFPKDIIRLAAQYGLAPEAESLINAIDKRNKLSHIYSAELAKEAEHEIKNHYTYAITQTVEAILQKYSTE